MNTRVSTHEEPLTNSIASKSRNPDVIWSEDDKLSIPAKRKKGGNMCSNSKREEIFQLNVTLEQVQELLRPPLTNAPTIVLIEGVEFEDYQVTDTVYSSCSFIIKQMC